MTPQCPSLLLAGLSLLALGLALPILVLLSAWFMLDAKGLHLLAEMTGTVLPDYALTSVLLCLGVGLGVVVGLTMGIFRPVRAALTPVIAALSRSNTILSFPLLLSMAAGSHGLHLF